MKSVMRKSCLCDESHWAASRHPVGAESCGESQEVSNTVFVIKPISRPLNPEPRTMGFWMESRGLLFQGGSYSLGCSVGSSGLRS